MRQSDAALYLPLSEATLHRVLDESLSWDHALDGLTLPELACLWLLSGLDRLRQHGTASPEHLLAEIIDVLGQEQAASDPHRLRDRCQEQLDRSRIEAGYYCMGASGIRLLDSDSCERQAYLTADGRWDFSFTQAHRDFLAPQRLRARVGDRSHALSVEQSRVFREFQANHDEHLHIQGYAGTGKTSLIKALLNAFESANTRILVLAEFKRQLDALGIVPDPNARIVAWTFGQLAEKVMPQDMTSAAIHNMRRSDRTRATQPDEVLIRRLGVVASGEHDTQQIITAVRGTVFRFCQSADETIDERHIPARHAARFPAVIQAVIAEHARQLWQAILSPATAEFRPQIRDYHRIKWAALNRWPIPDGFTHVLVDECHDLPPPVHQILSASPQARATLGDDYQNLRGHAAQRDNATRQREMVESIRSGQAVEAIVNPIIQMHPSRTKVPFQGNDSARLAIRYYRKAEIPETPAVILSSSTWGLFEWTQRLARADIQPALLGEPRDLDMFVQDCIELKAGRGGTRHAELFRYRSWEQLARDQAGNRGFQRVEQMLDKGYGHRHWKQSFQAIRRIGNSRYSLGMVENVRNLEFDTVMLTPDLLDAADRRTPAAFASMIYVAVTRARRQLIVPESLRDWVEQISAGHG